MSERLKDLLRDVGATTSSESSKTPSAAEESALSDQDLAALENAFSEMHPALDLAALTARTMSAVRPDLERNATWSYGRRTFRAVLAALVPLPLVLATGSYALLAAHGWISEFLPGAFATYLVTSYGAGVALMIASTYACIPLLAEKTDLRRLAPVGATS